MYGRRAISEMIHEGGFTPLRACFRIDVAPTISNVRNCLFPCFDIRPSRSLPPLELARGVISIQTKRDRRDDEQIHRRDAVGVIIEKCFPTLGRRASTPGHIGHAGLPYIDTELEKLAVDPRRSPQRIGNAQSAFMPRVRPTASRRWSRFARGCIGTSEPSHPAWRVD